MAQQQFSAMYKQHRCVVRHSQRLVTWASKSQLSFIFTASGTALAPPHLLSSVGPALSRVSET